MTMRFDGTEKYSDGIYVVSGVKNTHLLESFEILRPDWLRAKVVPLCDPTVERIVSATDVKLVNSPRMMTCPKCSEAAADRFRKRFPG